MTDKPDVEERARTRTPKVIEQDEEMHAPALLESPAAFASAFDAKAFRKRLEQRSANRAELMGWIKGNLVEDTDYGCIHVIKKERCDLGRNCTDPYHFSKPSLWKPGAEKICGMLGWTPAFPNLSDYTRMVRGGREIVQVVLHCVIYSGGSVIGEGIGARNTKQDSGDLNKALKMAKKSAHIDATLVAAGLSEIFTQDYGDQGDEDDDDHGAGPADKYASGTPRGLESSLPRRERGPSVDVATNCPIGKHKGTPWAEVPADYLDWIVSSITDKPNITDAAKKEIARRQGAPAEQAGTGTPDGNYDPKRPHLQGSSTLAEHARSIVTAKNGPDLEAAWKDVPEKFRPPLRGSYDERKAKVGNVAGSKPTTTNDNPM